MLDDWMFHHVGVACRDLCNEAEIFANMGYKREGEIFHDSMQGVRGLFLNAPHHPRLELLVNAEGSHVLTPWLDRGISFYHHAYETDSIDASLAFLESQRAKVITEPVPAVAFNGRIIAFVMLRNRVIIELIARR